MDTFSLETNTRKKKKWNLVLLHEALPSSCGRSGIQGVGQEAQILLARESLVDSSLWILLAFIS